MFDLIKKNNALPNISGRQPDRTVTYGGKCTARVTKEFDNDDGSQYRVTRKINKDGSITDKIEYRHS